MSIDPEIKRTLDSRLVSGEIGEEEYTRLLNLVKSGQPAPQSEKPPQPEFNDRDSIPLDGESQPEATSEKQLRKQWVEHMSDRYVEPDVADSNPDSKILIEGDGSNIIPRHRLSVMALRYFSTYTYCCLVGYLLMYLYLLIEGPERGLNFRLSQKLILFKSLSYVSLGHAAYDGYRCERGPFPYIIRKHVIISAPLGIAYWLYYLFIWLRA